MVTIMTSSKLCEKSARTYLYYQVIAAEGEQKASRALREAAEVISESPSALQVRMTRLVVSCGGV